MTSIAEELKERVIAGYTVTPSDIESLIAGSTPDQLYMAAAGITRSCCPDNFDSCSIVNAHSGHCSENCKWCAQSAHYSTGCNTYEFIDREECMREARHNHAKGVKRFSMVASGRAVRGKLLEDVCDMLGKVKREVGIDTCASLGLLDRDGLQKLWDAGVHRYHCNLETAPSFFPRLCTTHTVEDKLATIRTAREIGFEICSGGIIGMGETLEQRVEFAFKLREVEPVSIPVNILCPIKGTPLENAAPLSEEEILITIALFRFIHPAVQLRFAGGRTNLSRQGQLKALSIGINGGIVGDLLTTVGSLIDDDKELVARAGYRF